MLTIIYIRNGYCIYINQPRAIENNIPQINNITNKSNEQFIEFYHGIIITINLLLLFIGFSFDSNASVDGVHDIVIT